MGRWAFPVYFLAALILVGSESIFSSWAFSEGHKSFLIFLVTLELTLVSFAFYNLRANNKLVYGFVELAFAFFAAVIAVNAYELAFFAPYQLDILLPPGMQADRRWLKWDSDTIALFSVARAVWVFIRALTTIEDGLANFGNQKYLALWKWSLGLP